MIDTTDYLVIGAGIAGIAAAKTLHSAGRQVMVVEQQSTPGGLCGSFNFMHCSFDKFQHLLTNAKFANELIGIDSLAELHLHDVSYLHGMSFKHPVINNMKQLSQPEKLKLLCSYVFKHKNKSADNLYEFIKNAYGRYFADNFVEKFIEKMFCASCKQLELDKSSTTLETSLFDIIKGMFVDNVSDEIVYYPKHNALQKQAGFMQLLAKPLAELNVVCNKKCTYIDPVENTCVFNDNEYVRYSHLISTMPLPEIITKMSTVNSAISTRIADKFKHTCGYMISMLIDSQTCLQDSSVYILDDSSPAIRMYSPSLYCADNVAERGKISTLQAEIYFAESGLSNVYPVDDKYLVAKTVDSLSRFGIDKSKVLSVNVRREKYCNVIQNDATDSALKYAYTQLADHDIMTCGRFGTWQNLLSHEAWQNGIETALKLV